MNESRPARQQFFGQPAVSRVEAPWDERRFLARRVGLFTTTKAARRGFRRPPYPRTVGDMFRLKRRPEPRLISSPETPQAQALLVERISSEASRLPAHALLVETRA